MSRILMLMLALAAFATNAQDKVYLKNGTKIKGRLVKDKATDSTLYVMTPDGGIQVPFYLIKAVRYDRSHYLESGATRSQYYNSRLTPARKTTEVLTVPYDTGFYRRIGTDMLIGTSSVYLDDMRVTGSVYGIFGYRWNETVNIGLRSGLSHYRDYFVIPVSLYYELELNKRKVAPVIQGSAGYGFAWTSSNFDLNFDKTRGGYNYHLGFGMRINRGTDDILITIGGGGQQILNEVSDPDQPEFYYQVVKQNRLMRRMTLGIAFSF